jgi:hypothetical protein
MKTTTLELTKTELDYLYDLVCTNIGRGEYYGNRNQFMKMQDTVFDKLMDCKTEEG